MSDSSKSQTATNSRPEIELLLCCARLQMEAERVAQAFHLLKQSLDWEYLLKTANRHGVMPLVYRQMSVNFADAAPAEFMSRLHDHFYLNAAHNHLLTEELCRLLALFEEQGIPAVPYKGPALAQKVYGDVALRQFSDLDVLIQRKDVAKASALLRAQGFTSQHQLTPRQDATFLKIECEHMFTLDEGRVNVDLHWDFAPRYFSLKLDTESVWHRLERIEIVGCVALAFAPEDLLLILCVHASKEFWRRLIWLCDIAEMIRAHPELDWDVVRRRAALSGARRMLYLSLSLAHELLGAEIPTNLMRDIETDESLRALTRDIKRQLFRDEIEGRGIAQFLNPARALESFTDRARFRLRLALTPTPEDWAFLRLPASLSTLYYLTRPVRLAKKYFQQSS